MSDAKLVNIARLMTTYNFEIEQLPDNLKCAQCKLVLKDACQLPCCCRFCRACIDEMIARGNVFCPGDSDDCGESLLSRFSTDHLANKKVSKLAVKCPNDGCVHECQLDYMEEHLQECQRKSEDCPFRELGCTQDKLAAKEMCGHLQNENRRHSEILIEVIANINREIESLKQKDEASRREIETLKHELVLKDEQMKSIMDQMIHVQNDIKSIKEENEDLAGRARILTKEIERETAERRENDELDSARVIEHVDREIAAVTMLIESNKDELTSQMQLVRGDIGLINQDVQSIKDDICSTKSQVQSVQGEECPFRELGCTQDKLAAEEMGGHLQQENRRHSEILIVMITNINREIETLKRGEKVNSKEIEALKLRDEANSREIETLKQELVLKDGQIRSIMDQIINVQNEIKLIKEEKDDLAGRVRILTDGIEREIAERHENDELDRARVIGHVDTEIAVVTRLIESNKDDLINEIQLVKGDIGSINQGVQSINKHICSVNSEVQSIQALVGLGQVDASFVLLIDNSVDKTDWRKGDIKSEYFSGSVYPYKYRLTSGNSDIGTARAALRIQLSIYAGPNDGQLAWPFEGKVVITVTDRDRREARRSISRQCRIERPRDDGFRGSDEWRGSDIFEFLHSKLRKAGQNLTRGVQVSCVIVPGTG